MNIKGYEKLTDAQKQLFDKTYKKHIASMGSSEKEKHAEDKIKNVKWDKKENCLKVYFDDEWYHYYTNKTWG